MIESTGKDLNSRVASALNGEPAAELRRLIPLVVRRKWGAFFTGHALASELILPVRRHLQSSATVFDPACGAGDLLLACAKAFAVEETLKETVAEWGRRLAGFDIHPEFVRTTKQRLILLAQRRGAKGEWNKGIDDAFANIKIADFLQRDRQFPRTDVIVLNPPYSRTKKYKREWAQGNVSKAALFFEKCVRGAQPGTQILAVLPDVLRSGSRYRKWREQMGKLLVDCQRRVVGRFDATTDIDVFALCAEKAERSRETRQRNAAENIKGKTVGCFFDVRVGPVVPHRDKMEGKSKPYIDTRTCLPWESIVPGERKWKFSGTLFRAPFVVVRRTSSPTDHCRAVGTLIRSRKLVAVENHLLVLIPKRRGIDACEELIEKLRDPRTSGFLNKAIRCRHLTVGSLKNLPWWK